MPSIPDNFDTDAVLASMFTEPTGRHFLDSGGAYGRNWERNQGKSVDDYTNEPTAWFGYDCVTVSAFHWLRFRLTYDPIMDRKLRLWAACFDPDSPWLVTMEQFAAKVVTGDADNEKWHHDGGYLDGSFNSYNSENCLSQTIQFVMFTSERDGVTYVALQVHGGCDVRGGYTAPRVFTVDDDPAYMLNFNDYHLDCTAPVNTDTPLPGMPPPDPHSLSYQNEWVTYDGSFESDPWDGEDWTHETDEGDRFIRCPYCPEPTPMTPYLMGI